MVGTAIHAPGKDHSPATIERANLPSHVLELIERGFDMRVVRADGKGVWNLSNEECKRWLRPSLLPPAEITIQVKVESPHNEPFDVHTVASRHHSAANLWESSDNAVARQSERQPSATPSWDASSDLTTPSPRATNPRTASFIPYSPEIASQHVVINPSLRRRVTRSTAGGGSKPYDRCIEA